jgi:hypothetical protein
MQKDENPNFKIKIFVENNTEIKSNENELRIKLQSAVSYPIYSFKQSFDAIAIRFIKKCCFSLLTVRVLVTNKDFKSVSNRLAFSRVEMKCSVEKDELNHASTSCPCLAFKSDNDCFISLVPNHFAGTLKLLHCTCFLVSTKDTSSTVKLHLIHLIKTNFLIRLPVVYIIRVHKLA